MYYTIKKIGKEFQIEQIRTTNTSGSSRFSIDLGNTTENLKLLAALTEKLESKTGVTINYGYDLYLEGYTISRNFLIEVMKLLNYYPKINYKIFFQMPFYNRWKTSPTIFKFLHQKNNGGVQIYGNLAINAVIEHWNRLYRTKSKFIFYELVQLLNFLDLAYHYNPVYRWFANRLYEYDIELFINLEYSPMLYFFSNLKNEEVKNPKKHFPLFFKLLSDCKSDTRTFQFLLPLFAKYCKKTEIVTSYLEKLFVLIKTIPSFHVNQTILQQAYKDINEDLENSPKKETFYKFIELITPIIREDDKIDNETIDKIIEFTKPFWEKASLKVTKNALSERIFYYLLPDYVFPQFFVRQFGRLQKKEKELFKFILEGNNIVNFNDLPFAITKKQAHYFINFDSYNFNIHVTNEISYYLIWAKCMDIKMPQSLIYNILIHSNFMRHINFLNSIFIDNVILFFNRNKDYIDRRDIQTFLDFFYYKFQQNREGFNLLNRSVWSLLNDIVQWHDQLNEVKIIGKKKWIGEKIENFKLNYNEDEYEIVQITNEIDLAEEGKEMRHCVYSYLHKCVEGICSIWSLRKIIDKNEYERLLTIELRNSKIVQIKGFQNRNPNIYEKHIIYNWIRKEKIS